LAEAREQQGLCNTGNHGNQQKKKNGTDSKHSNVQALVAFTAKVITVPLTNKVVIMTYVGLNVVRYLIFWSDFKQSFYTNLTRSNLPSPPTSITIFKFRKIHPAAADLLHASGQIERHDVAVRRA